MSTAFSFSRAVGKPVEEEAALKEAEEAAVVNAAEKIAARWLADWGAHFILTLVIVRAKFVIIF